MKTETQRRFDMIEKLGGDAFALTEAEAEAFLGLPREKLKKVRQADRHRIAQGLPILGPPWTELTERSIRYSKIALIRWFEAKTVSA